MNADEAKEILASFRPGTEDEQDPLFAEARRFAEHDAEVAAWLKEQRAFDTAVSCKMQESSVPPMPAFSPADSAEPTWWRGKRLLALAACLFICGTLAALWYSTTSQPQTDTLASCRQDMADYLKQFPRLDLETENLSDVQKWLADSQHLHDINLPDALKKFPTIGCRALSWHGRKLSLICFMADGEIVHLVLIPKTAFPGETIQEKPQFAEVHSTTTAAWRHGDFVYLAITHAAGGEDFLRERL